MSYRIPSGTPTIFFRAGDLLADLQARNRPGESLGQTAKRELAAHLGRTRPAPTPDSSVDRTQSAPPFEAATTFAALDLPPGSYPNFAALRHALLRLGYNEQGPHGMGDGIDANVCEQSDCTNCGHASLRYRPFSRHKEPRYLGFAQCPACGGVWEF